MTNDLEHQPIVGDDGELLIEDLTVDDELYYTYNINDPLLMPQPLWPIRNMLLLALAALAGLFILSAIVDQSEKVAREKTVQTQTAEPSQTLVQPVVSKIYPARTLTPVPTPVYAMGDSSMFRVKMEATVRASQ